MELELYLIEILHQTTTAAAYESAASGLYLIEILHQTTTAPPRRIRTVCCILSKFYIKPQHGFQIHKIMDSCILSKFYIKPQRRRSSPLGQ